MARVSLVMIFAACALAAVATASRRPPPAPGSVCTVLGASCMNATGSSGVCKTDASGDLKCDTRYIDPCSLPSAVQGQSCVNKTGASGVCKADTNGTFHCHTGSDSCLLPGAVQGASCINKFGESGVCWPNVNAANVLHCDISVAACNSKAVGASCTVRADAGICVYNKSKNQTYCNTCRLQPDSKACTLSDPVGPGVCINETCTAGFCAAGQMGSWCLDAASNIGHCVSGTCVACADSPASTVCATWTGDQGICLKDKKLGVVYCNTCRKSADSNTCSLDNGGLGICKAGDCVAAPPAPPPKPPKPAKGL